MDPLPALDLAYLRGIVLDLLCLKRVGWIINFFSKYEWGGNRQVIRLEKQKLAGNASSCLQVRKFR